VEVKGQGRVRKLQKRCTRKKMMKELRHVIEDTVVGQKICISAPQYAQKRIISVRPDKQESKDEERMKKGWRRQKYTTCSAASSRPPNQSAIIRMVNEYEFLM